MAHSSNNVSLIEYLDDVNKGNILIPEFQRDFVWSKSKMLKLASSLLKGYPIGSFLLMQNTCDYSSRPVEGSITETSNNEPTQNSLLILDGQQRTTTAFQILYGRGKYRFYFDYGQFVIDIIDITKENFESLIEDKIDDWLIALPENVAITNPDNQRVKGYFPLNIILGVSGSENYVKWLDSYSASNSIDKDSKLDMDKFERLNNCKSLFITELIQKITSYQASEIIIDKNTNSNIVCTIFETINSTGQKLTVVDLLNAKCFSSGFILRKELEELFSSNNCYSEYLESASDDNSLLELSLIKTISLCRKGSCKKSDLLSLSASEISNSWNIAINYVESAIKYIKEKFGVLGSSFFPYKDILPVIAVIINDIKFQQNRNASEQKLDRWYWNAVFSGYFDNATESKSSKVIKELIGTEKEKGWFDDDRLIPESIKNMQITNFDFLDTLASNQSAQYKAILTLLALNDISDFSVSRDKIIGLKISQINDHHIFPKKFLSLNNIKSSYANTILNRTLISQDSNLKIKDSQPRNYIKDVLLVGNNELTSSELMKHCIDKSIVQNEFSVSLYDKFIEKRKTLIVDLIKSRLS